VVAQGAQPLTHASLAVQQMLALTQRRRMHRVFLVDGERRPVAVATLTDLMYAMAGEAPTGRPGPPAG
jgi:CBS domain-containing protein